ncbi:MAG: UbiA family prenyltransferase [Planctomycetota bacterium]
MQKTVAYLQLVRLPNLFTALSNVWAGMFIVNSSSIILTQFIQVSAISATLYGAGIVLNDYFDKESDRRHRPNRPLASGTISPKAGLSFAITLIVVAIAIAYLTSPIAIIISASIALVALLYDGLLKKWFIPAVIAMGLCRGLNWLLGIAGNITNPMILLIPAGVTIYIALITAISRKEQQYPALRKAVKAGISVIPLIDGAIVWAFGYPTQAGIVALLFLPTIIMGRLFEMT